MAFPATLFGMSACPAARCSQHQFASSLCIPLQSGPTQAANWKRYAGQWTSARPCLAILYPECSYALQERMARCMLVQPWKAPRLGDSTLSGVLGLDRWQGSCARTASPLANYNFLERGIPATPAVAAPCQNLKRFACCGSESR